MVKKIDEKEQAEQEAENIHMLNELKAEEEAERISNTSGVLGDNSKAIERFAAQAEKMAPETKKVSKKG